MRAVRVDDGQPRVVEVDAPQGDGVLVSVVASSICGSDLHLIDAGFAEGRVLGHEFAGRTPDGTEVAIEPILGCGVCPPCEAGQRPHCDDGPTLMGVFADGGMAEQVMVAASCLVPLPGGIDLATASLVEPLAVAEHALNRAGVAVGHDVLVIGAGPIGLAAAAVLAHRDISTTVSARHDHQRAAADRLGAGAEVADGYDVVIDAVGTTASLEEAVQRTKPQGRIGMVASFWDPVEVSMALCMKEVEIVPAMMYGGVAPQREFDEAARVLAANPEIAPSLITHRFPLDGAGEAFAAARDRAAGAIKVVFDV
ncbi:MAG: alcohol dehydrogenase catalytic domain-containing protein [Acidimicrobiales bacterium]|nr:alcohol dehydrogenase catalytic domain-containing protein [Acidimicrobiales bacterium]